MGLFSRRHLPPERRENRNRFLLIGVVLMVVFMLLELRL